MDQFISQGRIIVIMLGIIWFKNCLIAKNKNITQAEKNSLLIQNIGCCILILTYIAFELIAIADSIL